MTTTRTQRAFLKGGKLDSQQQKAIVDFVESSESVSRAPQYITAASSADLAAERVLTDTATLTWNFATAGQAKGNVQPFRNERIVIVSVGNPSFTTTPTDVTWTGEVYDEPSVFAASSANIYVPVIYTTLASASLNLQGLAITNTQVVDKVFTICCQMRNVYASEVLASAAFPITVPASDTFQFSSTQTSGPNIAMPVGYTTSGLAHGLGDGHNLRCRIWCPEISGSDTADAIGGYLTLRFVP